MWVDMKTWTIANGSLVLMQADLTTMRVDAIVNAANSRLAGGGGVDGAIHDVAGHDRLQAACREIIATINSLPAGQAVLTPGFALPAKHIIHTVGPIWRGGSDHEPEKLRNAYMNSLRLAHENNLKSIAFPAISCGVYGYPVEQAAVIALRALQEGLEQGLVERASMVLRGEASYNTWLQAANSIL